VTADRVGRAACWQQSWRIAGLLTFIGGGSIGGLLILTSMFSPSAASQTVSLAQLAVSVLAAVLLGGGYTLVHLGRG